MTFHPRRVAPRLVSELHPLSTGQGSPGAATTSRRRSRRPAVPGRGGPANFTDALASYAGLSPEYVHSVIDHAECYVKGNVHTNGLENYGSLFKRCIKGTHISVEPFHLFRYLDAEAFRYNNRKTQDGDRFIKLLGQVGGKRLTYKRL